MLKLKLKEGQTTVTMYGQEVEIDPTQKQVRLFGRDYQISVEKKKKKSDEKETTEQ